MDRLNMFAVIPELSLVVLASQIGRAAVMTLTRLPDNASNEPVLFPWSSFYGISS